MQNEKIGLTPGDLVRVKFCANSGSPLMCVDGSVPMNGYDLVSCYWFLDGSYHRAEFRSEHLVKS